MPPSSLDPAPPTLPVQTILAPLAEALRRQRRAVLTAPPGSGKTTRVPLALLSEPWLRGKILLLEPRRLAARLAAVFMAGCLGEEVGRTVGYRVRFDACVSSATRIEVVTEGILIRRLQGDPALNGVDLVIFDEFHERSLDSDLSFSLCLDAAEGLREDLRLLVMSATLDLPGLARVFTGAQFFEADAVCHPVLCRHVPHAEEHRATPATLAAAAAKTVRQTLAQGEGDILVFLPGRAEIRRCQDLLAGLSGTVVLPLHGTMPLAEQARAVGEGGREGGRRRVILATTIAETSLTIQGISTVVDSGWKRVPWFDPDSGLSRLRTVRVSRAAAAQRCGRAGRLGPGCCLRLWSEHSHRGLAEFDQPEILQADLADLVLELALWGADSGQLRWLDAPPPPALAQAGELLRRLGALDGSGRITQQGRRMAALPLHPRLAAMLVDAQEQGQGGLACDLAALLSERDLLPDAGSCDLTERLELLRALRRREAVGGLEVDARRGRRVLEVSRQLRRLAGVRGQEGRPDLGRTGHLVALAYPDRIARMEGGGGGRCQLLSGRRLRLTGQTVPWPTSWLAIAVLDAGEREGRVHLAAPLEEGEVRTLFANQLANEQILVWDPAVCEVRCRQRLSLGRLILAEIPMTNPEPGAVAAVLLATLRAQGLGLLPWTEAARTLQARVLCLASWQPEATWPDFTEAGLLAELEGWLGPHLGAPGRGGGLRHLDLARLLGDRLSWEERRRLDRDAPTHLVVPCGSRLPLRYEPGRPPVLAVRFQELFGLAETPRVAGGRVEVLLHLLSPAGRPVQITRDLAGFWRQGYQEVRRELQGRYPKHAWPKDPWQAQAIRGAPRRPAR